MIISLYLSNSVYHSHLLSQATLEKERAELLTRNATLERENIALDDYLRESRSRHRADLSALKTRLPIKKTLGLSPRIYKH